MQKGNRGFFIVIEGTDGSGKGTQFKLLVKSLRAKGLRVATLDFPQYGNKSAYFVEQYLNGKYGPANSVSPYIASLFYSLDRYTARNKLNKWLSQGKIVVANRFTLSNAAHQGGKINSPTELKKFWRWLFNLENKAFGLPEPDLTIVLKMPAAVAQQLVLKKMPRKYLKLGATRDIHEADINHLRAAELRYIALAKIVKAAVINCVESGRLLTPEEISRRLIIKVNNIIK